MSSKKNRNEDESDSSSYSSIESKIRSTSHHTERIGAGNQILDVSARMFTENNKLLQSLSDEVTRLRSENKGLVLTSQSLTDENTLLTDNLAGISEKLSQLNRKFNDVLVANKTLHDERERYKQSSNSLTKKLAEMESSLRLHNDQHVEENKNLNSDLLMLRSSYRDDLDRLREENSALRQYATRLEKECSEQYSCRMVEFSTSRLLLVKHKELEATVGSCRELISIEEAKVQGLERKNLELKNAAIISKQYIGSLLKSIKLYENMYKEGKRSMR